MTKTDLAREKLPQLDIHEQFVNTYVKKITN